MALLAAAGLATSIGLAIYLGIKFGSHHRRLRAEIRAARELIHEMTHDHWVFLSVSSRALVSSLDYRATLKKITRLAIPDLADSCSVTLIEENGRTTRTTDGADPRELELPETDLAVEVMQTREPVRMKRGSCSTLVVPLRSRNRTLGTITFECRRPGFEYTSLHQRPAEQIADCAALAIDNARLYEGVQKELRAREKLLALISHDVKNPLTAADISAQMLQKLPSLGPETDPRAHAMLQTIRRCCAQIDVLIRDLLEVAKIRSGNFRISQQRESFQSLLSGYVELTRTLAIPKNIQLDLELPERDRPVHVDAEKLFRVYSNIVGNAIKFTPASGNIRLRASYRDAEAVISIEDSGPGVAAEDLPHVFEEFWQAEETAQLGTGLGLTIARGIIEAHGGRIWAESQPGQGAAFHFSVPTFSA